MSRAIFGFGDNLLSLGAGDVSCQENKGAETGARGDNAGDNSDFLPEAVVASVPRVAVDKAQKLVANGLKGGLGGFFFAGNAIDPPGLLLYLKPQGLDIILERRFQVVSF